MATDRLQPVHDAKAVIAQRNKSRATMQTEFRNAAAAEAIADELTLMSAEMTVMRTRGYWS